MNQLAKASLALLVLLLLGWLAIQVLDSPEPQRREDSLELSSNRVEGSETPGQEVESERSLPVRVEVEPEESAEPREKETPASLARIPRKGVYGKVTYEDGRPAAGCSVQLSAGRHMLVNGRTDVEGNYAFEFSLSDRLGRYEERELEQAEELLEAMDRMRGQPGERSKKQQAAVDRIVAQLGRLRSDEVERAIIEVTAIAPLGMRATESWTGSGDVERVRVNLVLATGASFGGVVLIEGSGAPLAEVMLFDRSWTLQQSTQTDHLGKFEFAPPEAGAYHVHARKVGLGSAEASGVFLAENVTPVNLSLRLMGVGILRGRLNTPSGAAVPGVELKAVAMSLALGAMPRPTWPEAKDLAQFERGLGLGLSEGRTNDRGEFEIKSLQDGEYMLFFEGVGDEWQPEGIYRTGPDHKISFMAKVLIVELQGSSDLDKLRAKVHFLDRSNLEKLSKEPYRHVIKNGHPDGVSFVVEPGSSWTVFAELDGKQGTGNFVRIDDAHDFFRVSVEVPKRDSNSPPFRTNARPVEGMGRFQFDVRDAKNKGIGARLSLWRHQGRRKVQVMREKRIEAKAVLPSFEAGLYSWRIDPLEGGSPWSLPIVSEKRVHLRPGEEQKIEIREVLGGGLRVELRAGSSHGEDEGPFFVVARARGDDAPMQALRFPGISSGGDGQDFMEFSQLPLNEARVANPMFSPGRYTVTAHQGEVELASAEVEVKAGAWTEVSLVLATEE